MHGLEPIPDEGIADVFIEGKPYRITTALGYFMIKHLADWDTRKRARLNGFDTWDGLANRLEARLGRHIWHPSHWDAYWAAQPTTLPEPMPPPVPASKPEKRKERREKARVEQESLFSVI